MSPILTDDDIADILLSTDSTTSLARRFGVGFSAIQNVRKRGSKRSIRVATELGLLPLSPARKVWPAKNRKGAVVRASGHVATFS